MAVDAFGWRFPTPSHRDGVQFPDHAPTVTRGDGEAICPSALQLPHTFEFVNRHTKESCDKHGCADR